MSFDILYDVLKKYEYDDGVKDVVIPYGVRSIENYAFSNCYDIENVTIPDSVTKIGEKAFSNCYNIKNITMGNGVKYIGNKAFEYCKSLKSFTIPDSVRFMGNKVLDFCISLEKVHIGAGLIYIDDMPFRFVKDISISEDNPKYSASDGVVYNKSGTILIRCAARKEGKVIVPDKVKKICDGAFWDCSQIREIVIGKGVEIIGSKAFCGCINLFNVSITDNVKKIGSQAFENSRWLSLQENDFVIAGADILIAYKGNSSEVKIPYGVKAIGDGVFENCGNITSVFIPDSVERIGIEAFCGCHCLTSVNIPDSVKDIGYKAFYKCTSLKKLPAFGYFVDGRQWDWSKATYSDVKEMLEKKDYYAKVNHPTKFQFVAQAFLQDGQVEAEKYIKKHILEVLRYFIEINDIEIVQKLVETDKFVTKHNIMKIIDYAINNTQNGGDVQIQVFLMNYKNSHYPDMDSMYGLKF